MYDTHTQSFSIQRAAYYRKVITSPLKTQQFSRRICYKNIVITRLIFFITEKRKQKMATLREIILSNKTCPVSLIQKFAGLCISMTLAIPGAKLYSSACNRAISRFLNVIGPIISYFIFLMTTCINSTPLVI
jgi:hypothetical protein